MTFGLSGAALAGVAVGGATLVSGYMQSQAAGDAAAIQGQAAQGGIDEQRRQFDKVQSLLQPYTAAGTSALQQQMALLGLAPQSQRAGGGGGGFGGIAGSIAGAASDAFGGGQTQFVGGEAGQAAQQQAISALASSPQFQALQQQGENALLQTASATGGLRGGNLQGALAQFRPALLSNLIEQQYGRLGGLTTLGQNAAAGTGAAAQTMGTNVTNLLGQQGAAAAGGELAQARAFGAIPSAISGGLGLFSGLGGKF
jgi:hypothetical protein